MNNKGRKEIDGAKVRRRATKREAREEERILLTGSKGIKRKRIVVMTRKGR